MIDVEEIKKRISCVDYLQQYAGVYVENGKRCVSPIRSGASNPTSFYVKDDFFFDFGIAQGGDVIDLCALHKFNGNKGQAIFFLAEKLNINGTDDYDEKARERWLQYTNKLNNKIARWHAKLTDEDKKYLHERGLSDEIINRYRIGRTPDGRLSLPYYKNGYCCYYATRALPHCKYSDRKYMKMPIDDYNEHIVFGLDTITDDRSLICIAEGMFDCLSFIDSGYSCISAITGHFSGKQLKTVLPLLKTFRKVLIVYDNDTRTHAGEKFTYKMANILAKNQIPFVVGKVPDKHKDISELYAKKGKEAIDNLVKDSGDGIVYLAKHITEENDFYTFALELCKDMDEMQIVCIFGKLLKTHLNFSKAFIQMVKKKCLQPPTEEEIADEIINENRIKYNPALGHYLWNGNYWEKKYPEHIMQFAQSKLKDRATGSKIKSILKLIEARTVTDEIFNNKPVLNFQNGTLELDNGLKFREHRTDDMCTYCLSYDYNPNADYTEWEEFIEKITNFDVYKASCLQEFSGYILYPDNRLQKSLCCIGNGANGKSVFLNIISKVLGRDNVSNVEMSAFAQDFQRIKLMNSMLNISSETRSDVVQAETYFKQIVAGDTCTACYKGKDFVEFVPRAKLVMSCNEYLEPKDTSDGFLRRLLFVKFPVKFCDNPNPNNELEQKADRTLEKRFSQPEYLSGIMNWVISGYTQLKAVGGVFTEADDYKEVVEEFKTLTNPLIEFAREFVMPIEHGTGFRRISTEELYLDYTIWCSHSGYKAMPKINFVKNINKQFEEYRPEIKPSKARINGKRGYEIANN